MPLLDMVLSEAHAQGVDVLEPDETSKLAALGLTQADAPATIRILSQCGLKIASVRFLRWLLRLVKKLRPDLRSQTLYARTSDLQAVWQRAEL